MPARRSRSSCCATAAPSGSASNPSTATPCSRRRGCSNASAPAPAIAKLRRDEGIGGFGDGFRRAGGAEGLRAGVGTLEEQNELVGERRGTARTGRLGESAQAAVQLALVGLGDLARGMIGFGKLGGGVGERATAPVGPRRALGQRLEQRLEL